MDEARTFSLLSVSGAAALAAFLYLLGLAIYRLYLSPIARFPGPKLAALTLWYEFYYDVVRGGQYVFKINELHNEYGPIIRINPYELHVRDPDFYDVLYSGPGQKRDKWWWAVEMFGNSSSGFGTVSHDLHRLRRGALNPFFSKQAITRMEPLIRELLEKLCARFEQYRETSEPVDTLHAYAALTTDIITTYCFGTSYGCIGDPTWKWQWPQAMVESTRSVHLNKQFKWVFPAMQATPEWIVKKVNPPVMNLINFQKDLTCQIGGLTQRNSANEKGKANNIFTELITGDLPADEKSLPRLVDEGQTMIAAGQETSSFFLKQTSYFILSNPDVLDKLTAELEQAIPNSAEIPPLAQLEKLPYLKAVISEGHRFSHGVMGRLERISPDKSLQYQDWIIPAGTPVAMTSYLQHNDPSKFPNPEKFEPERWLKEDGQRSEKYLVPFSKGTRQCMGINLATAEIYLTLATVFRRFKMELYETTAYDVEIAHDYFIPHGHADSTGVRIVFK